MSTGNVVIDTAVATIEASLPALIAAAATGNPNAALYGELVLMISQTVMKLQGDMTPDQAVALFASNGVGLKAVHDDWLSRHPTQAVA